MTSMISNYVDIIKNRQAQIPQVKAQDALRTNVRAYRPKGYIIENNPYSLKRAFHSDLRSLRYFADGIQGHGNDYSIGKINDAAIKLGGLGIAGIISTSKGSPLTKGMEFVGLASWLAAMSLWPKLAINLPIKLSKGVDLNAEYITSHGHKKRFYQDPQFICWDMVSDAKINEMADKMGVPANIKNRRKAAENKARQIAIQGNTLAMLTAGFATPLAASIVGDKVGKHVLSPAISKFQELNAENLKEKMYANINNLLFDKESERLIRTLPKEVTPQTKEALYSIFDKMNVDDTLKNSLHSTLDDILSSGTSSMKLDESVNAKIMEMLPKKNNPKLNIPEFLKTLSVEYNGSLDDKTINSYLSKLQKEFVKKRVVSAEGAKKLIPEIKKLITSTKITGINSLDNVQEQLINLSRLVTTYNSKFYNNFQKGYFGYVWNNDTSINAKIWEKMSKSILPALGADRSIMEQIANAPSEEAANKALGEFLNGIINNPAKYNKVIKKLGNNAFSLSLKNEANLKTSLDYLDSMQRLLTAYDQKGAISDISRQIAANISNLRKDVIGKFLSTNNNLFTPIRILNVLKECKNMPEYSEIQKLLFENQTVDSFMNKLDNFKSIIRNSADYEKYINILFSGLSNDTRNNISSSLAGKIDDTSTLMKYLLTYQSDGVNIKYTPNDVNGAVSALKKFGLYKYTDEIFDVTFHKQQKIFEEIMSVIRQNPQKVNDLRIFLQLSPEDIENIKLDNFDSVYRDFIGSSKTGSGYIENGRHRFKNLLRFFEVEDISGISDFKITGAKAGKITAMQGATFKNFIKDSAKDLLAYNGWFKKVGLAFVGICAITGISIMKIGKKNEFNPDIYVERRA